MSDYGGKLARHGIMPIMLTKQSDGNHVLSATRRVTVVVRGARNCLPLRGLNWYLMVEPSWGQ